MSDRQRTCLGWTAVALSTLAACVWAFWGIVENFHEGWYYRSLAANLGLMLSQYLVFMVVFVTAALIALRWPRIGAGVHAAFAVFAAWFFRGASPWVTYPLIVGPLALMSAAYALGRPRPLRAAVAIVVALPLLTAVAFGIEPAYRVSRRLDDGDRSARRIAQNGVDLVWAPEGPGWPREGVTWDEAVRRCRYLSEGGMSLATSEVGIWRLPTAEEAVASMQRHGENSGGRWSRGLMSASYERAPDKESPLWDVHSPIIYWWTATEADDQDALIVVYDGKVWRRPKRARWGYLGFRAVRDAR